MLKKMLSTFTLFGIVYSICLTAYGSPKSFVSPFKIEKAPNTIYDLYRDPNNENLVIHMLYRLRAKPGVSISFLYDLNEQQEVLYEEYTRETVSNLTYEKKIEQNGYIKLPKLQKNYIPRQGYFYELPNARVFVDYSGHCSSPLDSHMTVVRDEEKKSLAFIVKGSFSHLADQECSRMSWHSELDIKIKTVPVQAIWQTRDDLFALAIDSFPSIFFINGDFSLSVDHNDSEDLNAIKIVDYDQLREKISTIEESFDQRIAKDYKSIHTYIDEKMSEQFCNK